MALELELTRLVQATNPDILCFLESKVNADKLMRIAGFEKWVEGRIQKRDLLLVSKDSLGTDIIVFSKVNHVSVTYGMNSPQFDEQARVLTIEYEDHIWSIKQSGRKLLQVFLHP